ncbi:MAG: thiamine-phosphate synthase family protein [Fervidicoccaceae archaeon]
MEYVSSRVTQALSALFVTSLIDRGHSQYKVSRLSGLSQPMINKLARVDEESLLSKLERAGLPRDEVLLAVDLVAEAAEKSPLEALKLLSVYELSVVARKLICQGYERENAEIEDSCTVIDSLYSREDIYVAETRMAFERFEKIPGVVELVPEVGANIAVARPRASSYLEVVAFPGRIIKLDEKVMAVGSPVYGGSKHTAHVLLLLSKVRPEIRACISIKRLERFVEEAKRWGLRVCEVRGEYASEEELLELLSREVEERGPCDVIDASRGLGMEPIVYVLGRSGLEAVEIIGRLLALSSERLESSRAPNSLPQHETSARPPGSLAQRLEEGRHQERLHRERI